MGFHRPPSCATYMTLISLGSSFGAGCGQRHSSSAGRIVLTHVGDLVSLIVVRVFDQNSGLANKRR